MQLAQGKDAAAGDQVSVGPSTVHHSSYFAPKRMLRYIYDMPEIHKDYCMLFD